MGPLVQIYTINSKDLGSVDVHRNFGVEVQTYLKMALGAEKVRE